MLDPCPYPAAASIPVTDLCFQAVPTAETVFLSVPVTVSITSIREAFQGVFPPGRFPQVTKSLMESFENLQQFCRLFPQERVLQDIGQRAHGSIQAVLRMEPGIFQQGHRLLVNVAEPLK